MSTRSKERSSIDFPAGAGPGKDLSLSGERELSGVSIDCIAPVRQEYVLVQVSYLVGTRRTPLRCIHAYATGGLRRGQLEAIMCRPATRNMSSTHSHRGTSAIGAGAGRPSLLGRSDALDVLSAGRPLSVPKRVGICSPR